MTRSVDTVSAVAALQSGTSRRDAVDSVSAVVALRATYPNRFNVANVGAVVALNLAAGHRRPRQCIINI